MSRNRNIPLDNLCRLAPESDERQGDEPVPSVDGCQLFDHFSDAVVEDVDLVVLAHAPAGVHQEDHRKGSCLDGLDVVKH